jgi:hypothetical protein
MPDLRPFLRQVGQAVGDPQLPGPLNAIPRPIRAGLGVVGPLVPGVGALASPGGQVGQALAGKIMENPVGNAISGEGLYAIARIVQAARAASGPDTPSTPMSLLADQIVAQGAGHPIRIQQMVEHSPNPIVSKAAGAQAMVFDPANFVGAAGEGAQAAKLGRVGDLLTAVDRAQNLPVEALGALARQGHAAAKLRLLREVTGNVADEALPVVGGKKQLGPIRPPEQFGYARGNVPGDQLVPKVGRNGGKGVGPLLPPELGPPAPETPPATQPVADLLNAARKSAQPNPLEQLIGAGRGTAAREVAPIQPRRTIAQIEAVFPKRVEANPGQVGLPQESGVIPADRLRLGLHPDQADFLDEIRAAVQRGDPKEIGAVRDFATSGMQIPADRVSRTIEETYQALGAEDRAARIAAIEGSPHFEAFQYFKKNGEIKPVNPTNGKRIPGAAQTRDQIWNLPGSGYDEVADGILARYQFEGHNQNYGQGSDDFWREAQQSFRDYQALKKPGAQAALPEVTSGGIPASQPFTPPAPEPAALDFSDRAGTIRAVANAPIEHLNLVLRDLHHAVYPGQQADFAIPALTGKGRQEFRTSFLTDHPGGNAAEPYLDYLISRVQKDPKAAARLAEINPLLADDVGLVAENPLPLTEHKRLVQSLFDVGPQGGTNDRVPGGVAAGIADAGAPSGAPVGGVPAGGRLALLNQEAAPSAFTGTLDDVRNLVLGESKRVNTQYPPSDPAFYAKRANVDPAQVPAMLDQLVREGTLGRLPDGSLGIKPATPLSNVDIPPAITDPAERAAWQARYVGQSQSGTDILAAGDKVAGGDLTQADLNALSPQERMSALRRLAAEPAAPAPAQTLGEAIAAHRALPGHQRAAALGDIYREAGAPKEVKGIGRSGEEIVGYAYSPDLFIKSDATGVPIRHYVTLPNGMRVHPDELRRATITPGGSVQFAPPVAAQVKIGAARTRGIANLGDLLTETILPGANNPRRATAEQIPVRITLDDGSVVETTQGAVQAAGKRLGASLPVSTFVADHLNTAVTPKPSIGGDLAAGGGGFGLLPARGGLGAANRAVAGAATGALAGGAAGAAASPDDRLGGAAKGAAAGALLGGNLGAGAGLLESRLAQGATNSAGHPLLAHAWEQAKVEQAAANAASGNLWSAIKNLPAVWRRNVTEHPKNMLGDDVWGRVVTLGAQGPEGLARLRQVRTEAAQLLDGATPWERLPETTRATMAALGREGQVPDLGSSFHTAESNLTKRVISTSDQMIGSGILSLANPAAIAQNLVGAGGSVALGAVRPGWHGFFQAVNGFQQETFRQAAFADEAATGLRLAAERFLPDLAAAGVDIARLAPDGSFGVKDVHAVAGQAAADRWRAYGDAIYDSATRRVKFLFGDFSKRGGIEKALGGPIPFTSWLIRAYPVALSLLAQHPAVALAAYQYMRLTSQGAGKDGRPGYTAGMIPVDDQTPILGALVRLYTQGEGGKGYLDPIGGISPVGGDLFAPAEDDSQKNWYQRGTALLGRLGLPGVNPAIQAGAYVAGLDYKAPGALSRTQGLENAAALLPGNPQLPDVAGGLLRAARGAVSQATAAAGLPGAQADKTPVAYDPITRRYAELWYAKTGKALNDPSDPSGLLAMGDPENALMQQARREVLLGGAAKNVGSLTSPVGVIGQSGENAQYRAAKVGEPFSAARIAGSSPGVQQLMQAGNTQYRQATPASQIYTVGNREQGAYSLLDQFDADPQNLWLKQYAPKSYKMRRDELMIRLGLKEPPKPPRQNPYLPAGR